MLLKKVNVLFLCFALTTVACALSQTCSLNVMANNDYKQHPAFNSLVPVRSSIHEAVAFVEDIVSPPNAPLDHEFTVCIFGPHVIARAVLIDHRANPASPARIIWLGFDASISGAIQLQSWRQVVGATYSVAVPPSFTAPTIRDLWPAGKAGQPPRRASRSTLESPAQILGNMTPWQSSSGVVGFVTEHDIPADWQRNTQAIEFVWPIVVANWIEPRCCVRSVDGRNITLADPCGALLVKRNVYAKTLAPPVRVEAVPTAAPPAGSFYHDSATRTLLYTLLPDETAADLEASSFTTAMESLLVLSNSSRHSWVNVSFQFSTWSQPNSPAGYVDTQSCVYAADSAGNAAEPPAAVTITLSTDIEILGCAFSAIGSPYALLAGSSSSRVNITDSHFFDLSGGAVRARPHPFHHLLYSTSVF
jgi:hypothetical protein